MTPRYGRGPMKYWTRRDVGFTLREVLCEVKRHEIKFQLHWEFASEAGKVCRCAGSQLRASSPPLCASRRHFALGKRGERVAAGIHRQDDKWRVNYHISESGHDSRVSYLTGKPLADKSHISTSKTYSQQRDYRFDTKIFTELKNAQSVTLAYDGLDPLPPMYCYLKPYFNDVNQSYFEQLAEGRL